MRVPTGRKVYLYPAAMADLDLAGTFVTFAHLIFRGDLLDASVNGTILRKGTTMSIKRAIVFAAVLGLLASAAPADKAAPLSALVQMPVKEITVFKDGHALVLHEGQMPTDDQGDVLMDYLPQPIMGAFWPYSANKDVALNSVVAGRRKVLVDRTALNLRELLAANVGAEAIIEEVPAVKDEAGAKYPATIIGLPARSGEELEKTSPPNSGEMLPQQGNLILLKTAEGTKAVNIDRIQEVTFKGDHKSTNGTEEFRYLLRMKLDWGKAKPRKAADVGMMYVQKGVRWIPNYKVDIDGKGTASIKLQATLINELTDLEDVTAQLVIGVPTFAFQDTPDPISFQQAVAQLSAHFARDSRTANQFSNAIMTQARLDTDRPAAPGGPAIDLGPEITGSQKNEDLFVFTLKHLTLRKGQRTVLTVAEFPLPYRDVFKLDIPFAPPPEVWRNFDSSRQAELSRILSAPKVMHAIRLTNKSQFPLTTAPALIVHEGKVLSQGMMTYTPKGADTDLPITAAMDIAFKKTDKEAKRTPNAANWEGNSYNRADYEGLIKLTNYREAPVDLEVTRYVLGNIDEANMDGAVEMLNAFEDSSFLPASQDPSLSGMYPFWWGWYSWPYWWSHFNGVGQIKWKLHLEPGPEKAAELKYAWHYFWR